MYVVPEEDILMFARGLIGRQGPNALRYARKESHRLAKLRDEEGAAVWQRVAEAVAARVQG